ncbi:MAG: LacI family transcriptional regulator [Ruminococcaceae bacterium]|nr:LacI family transcriptional regulator [Oscillospiraceae bacterium]
MRITMNDIAKKLNISVNTVSKALNGKAKVSDSLRETIIKTAEEMGYVKNQNAARLATKPLKIGVIICGYDKNYYQYTLSGLKKAFSQLADSNVLYEIKLFRPDAPLSECVLAGIAELEDKNFDGIIFNDIHLPCLQKELLRLQHKGIATALLNYDIPGSSRSFCVTNNYSLSASFAAEQLAISLKHSEQKNILLATHGSQSHGQSALAHEFQSAAKRFGLSVTRICNTSEEQFLKCITSDIQGIYITHANSLSVCQYLSECKFSPTLILSDIYPEMSPYFEDGTITASIFQNPQKQAYKTVMKLYQILSEAKSQEDLIIEPLLLLRSNYHLFLSDTGR